MTSTPDDSGPQEECSFHLGRASEAVRACKIAEGVWTIYALHQPPVGPPLPNRCVIYEMDGIGDEKPTLAVVNAITPDSEKDEPFATIRRLAAERGADVAYIFNPGPEHHISMHHYARAFPAATIVVAAGRIERENPELCALSNVKCLRPGDVLPELAERGFHVHIWDGLMEGKIGNVAQGRFRAKRGTAESVLFYHTRSKTLLNGGHGWWYWGKETYMPWLARKMFRMKKGKVVWSPMHYRVFDKERCARSAARVLEWDVDLLLDLHVPLNDFMSAGVQSALHALCTPMVEGNWNELPLKQDSLQILEE